MPSMLSKLKKTRRQPGEERIAQTRRLVERHFVMQDERPAHLREVEIDALDPFLRSLLFTDGTVTRALGVRTLAPVSVTRVSQTPAPLPADVAGCLEIEAGGESIRRRVSIGIGSSPLPVLWAESHLVPDRLPPGFMGLLDGAPDGIGQSLQRVALESCRELLWFGLSSAPEWTAAVPAGGADAIERLYRIVNGGAPAILISESFAVERRGGSYHLSGLGEGGA